jgi:predicted DNA-binding transcriptional regulator AlpA
MTGSVNSITLEQLQLLLGVKERTIKLLIKENDFPEHVFFREGRTIKFKTYDLFNWFQSMEARICQR